MADLSDPCQRFGLAMSLLAVDPGGLGGITIRSRAGPVREHCLDLVGRLAQPAQRISPTVPDDALFGGLDVAATLSAGSPVYRQGLIETTRSLVLAMAERTTPRLAARIAMRLDEGQGPCLVALDEGAEPDEALPASLAERLAFAIDLSDVAWRSVPVWSDESQRIEAARDRLSSMRFGDDAYRALGVLCLTLGIDSARAPMFAKRAAVALAALDGRDCVVDQDIETAAALTLAHRATHVPAPEEPEQDEQPPEPPQDQAEQDDPDQGELTIPDELLLEAVRALIPDDLLARLSAARARAVRGSGAGARVRGNRRGRPLPSRPGRVDGGARVDLVATLRAAAPWQTIRKMAQPDRAGIHVRMSDIRVKRYEDRSDRLLVFAVDASGSSAIARLAEAKGAVELLLGQAYARRDHVALIAFRGDKAELLLSPTRSLVRTKKQLAALPGGGGTPLAAGLQAAMELADHARRRGLTPTMALLTDGRANIALNGEANRAAAAEDAQRVARSLRMGGMDSIVIDTGNRPEKQLRTLSEILDGTYLPLPRANAERLSEAVSAALE